jgi:hypothetical protein
MKTQCLLKRSDNRFGWSDRENHANTDIFFTGFSGIKLNCSHTESETEVLTNIWLHLILLLLIYSFLLF